MAQARFNLGSLLADRGDLNAACDLLWQAVASGKEAMRLSPDDASIGMALRAHRDRLTGVLIRLGAHVEAAAVAEDQLRDLGPPAATLAANGLTSCAALAARDPKLTRDARAAAARSYARRARDLLRDAARPGGDPTAAHHLIWFLVNCPVAEFRDPIEAIRMAHDILARSPDSWVAWANLGARRVPRGQRSRCPRSPRAGRRPQSRGAALLRLLPGDGPPTARRLGPGPGLLRSHRPMAARHALERGRPSAPRRGRRAPRAAPPRLPDPEDWRRILPFVH